MNDKKRKIGAFLGIIALLLVVFWQADVSLFLPIQKQRKKLIPFPDLHY